MAAHAAHTDTNKCGDDTEITDAEEGEEVIALDLRTDAGWRDSVRFADHAAARFRDWYENPGKELDLGMHGMRQLPPGFWEQARGVEKLQLYRNRLNELPTEVRRLGVSLRKLNLAGNQELKTLPGHRTCAADGSWRS